MKKLTALLLLAFAGVAQAQMCPIPGNPCGSGDVGSQGATNGATGAGNPIDLTNGNKYQQETDLAWPGDFSLQFQADLAREAQALAARGIPVVLSNHDTELTRQLYAAADSLRTVAVQRFISCDGGNRGKAGEIIAVFEGS